MGGTRTVVTISPKSLMIIFVGCYDLLGGRPDLKAPTKGRQYSKDGGRDWAQFSVYKTLEPTHSAFCSVYQRQNQLFCFQEAKLCPQRKDAMLTLSWKWAGEGLLSSNIPTSCQLETNKISEMESCVINGY